MRKLRVLFHFSPPTELWRTKLMARNAHAEMPSVGQFPVEVKLKVYFHDIFAPIFWHGAKATCMEGIHFCLHKSASYSNFCAFCTFFILTIC